MFSRIRLTTLIISDSPDRPRNLPIPLRSWKANRPGRSPRRRPHHESKNLQMERSKSSAQRSNACLLLCTLDYPWNWWMGDILRASYCYLWVGDDKYRRFAANDHGECRELGSSVYADTMDIATFESCVYSAYHAGVLYSKGEVE